MKDRYTVKELAHILGVSRQAVLKRAKKEGWTICRENIPGRGGRRILYLPGSFPKSLRKKIGYTKRVEAHAWAVRQGLCAWGIAGDLCTHPFMVTRWLEGKEDSERIEEYFLGLGCPPEFIDRLEITS